jgi:hypothetical protein
MRWSASIQQRFGRLAVAILFRGRDASVSEFDQTFSISSLLDPPERITPLSTPGWTERKRARSLFLSL